MSPTYGLVKDITPKDTHWALRLRLVRMYENVSDEGAVRGLECVFHDRELQRIHATIKSFHTPQFKDVLKEGLLYKIRHFMVATDGKDYKTTTNKYKIIFFKKTKVFEFEDATFPNEVYKFRQFETILSTKILNEKEMFDVICVVVGKYGLKELTYNNRPHKIMEIVVCDNMMRQLRCSLWDQYADQILPYMADDYPGPVILILQFCRAKMFQGEPKLCDSLNITKLIVNGDGVEFQNFKDSIVDRTALSQTITTLSATYKPFLDELNSLVMPL
ncbi:unnamed protein product [Cuscuta epithymum]|uniref:Replication protein A 70 kDa DNA-binding subunit B/D first OB fold domain-containing protein n=1 Tax=Cuscuta epithymum TaxID=186058 RepID=A0AAV0G3S1_9ASTE|nr:unnamed protein product [Cuscuta epithymum]